MASSSSSSSTPSSQSLLKKYDVFISFRGEDTRFNFTSHLHEALRRNQIETYIDYRLEKGDEVWPSLEKAIQDSILFLVIFSENYASSTWCLKELSKILECSNNQAHFVMPVFYRVDPSDVRKQSGSYKKAFEQHEIKRINSRQLQMWREALTYAANLSGWHCRSDSNEAELIKEIVKCVEQKLSCNYQSEDYLKDLIGIHKRMRDVESLLEKGSNNVQFVGIWGMGGIGKSTLAQALFNKLCLGYEGSFFLANVREKSRKDGIDDLKKKLILELLGDGDQMSPIAMRRLSHKKVLIVLDDVDDHDQLENLAGRHDWFGSGSKILITTRDRQVFGKKVDDNDIYQLEALSSNYAFQLFSLNAFKTHYGGDPKIQELTRKVTEYAGGNPLALKVLGSLLYGRNQEAWESQLKKLQRLPCSKINDILKFSFEGLDHEEKNIFLLIACFLDDYDVEDIKVPLDVLGYSTKIGLTRLEDKALLNIHNGRIQMHHMIKEMGQQIVREESLNDPKRCSILWICKKNSLILKKNKALGSEAAEGIIIDLSEVEEMCLSDEAFHSMPNLKFLDVDHRNSYGHQFENKLKFHFELEFLPKSLILLRWAGYPSKSLPTTFNAESLIEIKMPDSNLTKLWDGVQNLVNLKNIYLEGSMELIELPDFSKAIHMIVVDLTYCKKLQSVHPSILGLHNLRSLWLRDCESLTSVISSTHLKSLRYLDITGCSRLNKFSVSSENLNLRFSLRGTSMNGELCSSSGHLNKIERLDIGGCDSVTSVHKLIDPLYIRELYADGCNKIASNLRSAFDEMRALQLLCLSGCRELVEVPDNICLLSSLRELYLPGSNIETLPASIKHLTSLKWLYLNGCKRLRCLPQLPPSICGLDMEDCISLEILHSPLTTQDRLPNPPSRRILLFRNCVKLDGESIKAAEARVALDINKAIHDSVRMEYPGERVPEWFVYRTKGSFLTLDLSSILQPWHGSFIFCAVLSSSSPPRPVMKAFTGSYVDFFIDGQYACTIPRILYRSVPLLSDHVVVWYSLEACGEVERKIEEKKREAQTNTYHPLLQFQFSFSLGDEEFEIIKECGVCPTSAVGFQNYIQQLQLPLLHPHPNSSAIEAPSRKRKISHLR